MPHTLAIVSGASSGIGAATAELLGALGWHVVLVARRRGPLEALATRIVALGGGATVAAIDAADAAAVGALVAEVRAELGPPGAVVNAAGAGEWRWLEDTPPADMERMLDAPFRAAYHLSQAVVGDMLTQRGGVLVQVGSPASLVAWPSATAYTCARWALRGLHEALVADLHGTGVHSCHVLFGKVSSAYFTANPGSEEHIPTLGRLAPEITPAECAEVIVRTIHAPRAQVLHPPTLRLLQAANRVAPGAVRVLARRTGRQR